MGQTIYLELEGRAEELSADTFLTAAKDFLSLLRDVDAALSHKPRGRLNWTVGTLRKESPAIIGLLGKVKDRQIVEEKSTEEYAVSQVHAACLEGLALLEGQGERPAIFSNEMLSRVRRLARGYGERLARCTVMTDGLSVRITSQTLAHVDLLIGSAYEAYGSVVGRLESVTLRRGQEFRVWEEVTGQAVICRFGAGLFEKVKHALGRRVLVYGFLTSNAMGVPTTIAVEEIEIYPSEEELPTIEEISGIVPNLTEGKSLAEYLQDLSDG